MIRTVLTLSVLLLPTAGFACSCAFEDIPLKEAVNQSFNRVDSVVLAQAIRINPLTEVLPSGEPVPSEMAWGEEVTQFNEIQSWKGSHGKFFHTKVNTASGMCGYSFSEGETYLLYLYGTDEDGYYATSTCSRTKPLIRLEGELEVLNELTQHININTADR